MRQSAALCGNGLSCNIRTPGSYLIFSGIQGVSNPSAYSDLECEVYKMMNNSYCLLVII